MTVRLEDPARCELLFQRHIPGSTPSPASSAPALGGAVALMHDLGITEQGDVDCLVAVTAGLVDAQMSNDPGGDRWIRHLDRLIDLLVDDARTRRSHP